MLWLHGNLRVDRPTQRPCCWFWHWASFLALERSGLLWPLTKKLIWPFLETGAASGNPFSCDRLGAQAEGLILSITWLEELMGFSLLCMRSHPEFTLFFSSPKWFLLKIIFDCFEIRSLFLQPKESQTCLSHTVEYVTSSAMSGDLTSCHQGRQSHLYVHEPIGSQVIIPTDWCRRPLSLTDGRWYMSPVVTALANGLFLFLSFFASLKKLLFVQLQKKKLSLTDGQRIISFLFLIICLTTTNRKFFWPTGDDMSTVVTAAANGLYQCHLQSLPLVICLTCY